MRVPPTCALGRMQPLLSGALWLGVALRALVLLSPDARDRLSRA